MSPHEALLHSTGCAPRPLTFGRAVDVLDGGNHHPLLCELEEEPRGGPAGIWVVKPQDVYSTGNRRPGAVGLLAELAAAEVCAWAGVRTPAIGLLRFPNSVIDDLVTSVPKRWRSEVRTVFEMNKGRLAFCCRFLQEAIDLDAETLKGPHGRAAAQQWGAALFAVDAYTRHDDRRRDNPNAVWLHDEIVAIDHGAAFAGIDGPGTRGSDLAGRTVLPAPGAFREHVFYAALCRCRDAIDWSRIAACLAEVPDEAIERVAAAWPGELEPYRAKFVEFLKARKRYAAEVIDGASRLIQAHPKGR